MHYPKVGRSCWQQPRTEQRYLLFIFQPRRQYSFFFSWCLVTQINPHADAQARPPAQVQHVYDFDDSDWIASPLHHTTAQNAQRCTLLRRHAIASQILSGYTLLPRLAALRSMANHSLRQANVKFLPYTNRFPYYLSRKSALANEREKGPPKCPLSRTLPRCSMGSLNPSLILILLLLKQLAHQEQGKPQQSIKDSRWQDTPTWVWYATWIEVVT